LFAVAAGIIAVKTGRGGAVLSSTYVRNVFEHAETRFDESVAVAYT
jgi:hypothetical protein